MFKAVLFLPLIFGEQRIIRGTCSVVVASAKQQLELPSLLSIFNWREQRRVGSLAFSLSRSLSLG